MRVRHCGTYSYVVDHTYDSETNLEASSCYLTNIYVK